MLKSITLLVGLVAMVMFGAPAEANTRPVASSSNIGIAAVCPLSGIIVQEFHSRHQALDIQGLEGSPVRAAFDGVVTSVGNGMRGAIVEISHGVGRLTYVHLIKVPVGKYQIVNAGQWIGDTNEESHLHLEYRDNFGNVTDPRRVVAIPC